MNVLDFVGIGFGPANIALAVALEERGFDGSYVFLERHQSPGWQREMLLDDSDIQNHPLRDLVTPANPRSYYSFTNYLHVHKRLFDFLNLGITFPLRREYADYVVWVARHFAQHVRYGVDVQSISLTTVKGELLYRIESCDATWYARSVVLAPGRTPNIPQVFEPAAGPDVFHLTRYEQSLTLVADRLEAGGAIAVIGGSQSAAELVLDLAARFPASTVHAVHRAYSFRLKDTSPFSEEVYFPEFVDYYYNASDEGKRILNAELKATNYSSADGDVIHKLYLRLYAQRIEGKEVIRMHRSHEVEACEREGDRYRIEILERLTGARQSLQVDAVVLATGFKNFGRGLAEEPIHPLMTGIRAAFAADRNGGLQINRNYSLQPRDVDGTPPFFVNGLCESSHGLGDAGSFSILSLRAVEISSALRASLKTVEGAAIEA
ncbi:SidA/IucD/PvdA family monooxygenase [Paraburkholderia sp. Tr-20389]|uniref:lysine N(6)-hydroxylase/L-ornithine N(5)-oxygenase family protein n=1 Tax=Paraburkholderia sp. Tr-20389 TaxID=2703903 RepID=UPI00197DF2B7|nr:SidA/IucD/PvdA family monooxygenase [Paraburkholderia sp. Tr-20389]MBN3753276.1 SidA/IucD/PvdA family monooxygenase [Paraburkholderia sp. Tr-20389]